jgi:hypothetical protein
MPIKFEIYREGSRVTSFEPVASAAIGPESVPISGDIVFRDGLLILSRRDEHASGISLLWDVGPLGTFVLETTRLPPRDKPYNLNVELARFRLMKIMQKQEDWNLFDFPKVDKFAHRFQEAQNLFAEALAKLDQPGEAAKLADRALEAAVDVSEQLAMFHADHFLARRKASNGFAKHVFGARIDPEVRSEKYREAAATQFDYIVVPCTWKQIQPHEHAFSSEAIDEWVEMLSKRRVPTVMGPIVRLDQASVPDWMVIWEHDFDMLREMAYEYVQKVVTRYRRAVSAWSVVAGLPTNAAFTLNFEQVIELTRLLVGQVKTLIPNARTMVTITQPYGEYHARGRTSVPPMLYAEMVAQAGINFEAFGLEIECGIPQMGMFDRDLFQLSCLLDRFSTLGRPVFVTAVGCPGRSTPDPDDTSEGRRDPAAAGRWRRPWDSQLQAEWLDAVYQLALSKPFVESIAWSNLADIRQTLPAGGLLDEGLRPKPAFHKLQQVREKFRPTPAPKK